MESEFQKLKEERIKAHKNRSLSEIIIYIAAVFIMFGLGGKVADLATGQVPLISVDGIIKMIAIIFMVIITGFVFILGPLIIPVEINKYYELKD